MTEVDTQQATSDTGLFPYFEDIVEYQHYTENAQQGDDESDGSNDEDEEEDDSFQNQRLDAQHLNLDQIFTELQKRGLKARGFFSDDAKTLQQAFDAEYEAYQETKRKERIANKERRERERLEKKRRKRIEIELKNEQEQLDNDERLAALLVLMKQGRAPINCRIELNAVTARTFAFAQYAPSSNIVYLDVSNQGLPDYAGAYLCRALGKNSMVKKLELGSNKFGIQTCKELGAVLTSNAVVEYVCLECNPLVEGGVSGSVTGRNIDGDGENSDSLSGIRAIAEMLSMNKTLRHLSLWQCMIGADGGKMMADVIESSNSTVVMLKSGYNAWEDSTIRRIDAKTSANREIRRVEREAEARQREHEELRRLEEKRMEEEKARLEANEIWLEEQRKERAENRRKEMEEEKKAAKIEKERAEEEERKRAEEAALAAKKKKKKTKKKGGKRKKKI